MTGIVIHRSRHAQEYVVVPNSIARDRRLSFRARGLLVMLLSLPPEWQVTTDALSEDNPEGRDQIRKAMTELRDRGYVVTHREQGGNGLWRSRIEVFDTPQTERDPSRVRCDQQEHASSQVAPNAEKPNATRLAPKESTEPKYGGEVQENRSRPASQGQGQDQDHEVGQIVVGNLISDKEGLGLERSAANSHNPRVHHGPKNPSPDAQQRAIPATLQSQAADRNARETEAAERRRQADGLNRMDAPAPRGRTVMANVMIPLFATSGDLALDYLADYWHEANARWFRGKMTPVPIVVMPPSNRRYPPLGRYADERIEIRRDLLGGLDQPDRYWNATGTVLHEMIHQYLCEHVDWRGVGHDDRFTAWCNKIGADLGLPEVVTRKPRGRKVPLSRYWPSCAKPAMQAGAA